MGEKENGVCVNQRYYRQADVIIDGVVPEPIPDPEPPVPEPEPPTPDPEPTPKGDWVDALLPHIPKAGEVKLIPNTSFNDICLDHDGSAAATYLRINGSGRVFNAWIGMGFDEVNGIIWVLAPGGHADGGANAVYKYIISEHKWYRVYDYAMPAEPWPDLLPNPDGITDCVGLVDGPMASHSYDGVVYIPTIKATLIMGTSGFYPNWKDTEGNYCNRKAPKSTMWLWLDSGGWVDTGVPSEAYVRCVYDKERDVIYALSKTVPQLYELDPHTWQRKLLTGKQPSTTGSTMTMLGRDIYWTTVNSGFYRMNVSPEGVTGSVEKLLSYDQWENKGWGLASDGKMIIAWDGDRRFMHYDTESSDWGFVNAGGDDLDVSGSERVYGKFVPVPEVDKLFMGMIREGLVLYKAE